MKNDIKKFKYLLAFLILMASGLGIVSAQIDHSGFAQLAGPFADGQAVTAACVQAGCHQGMDTEVMSTRHYTWLDSTGDGKANTLNNFCMYVGDGGEDGVTKTSEKRCGQCHAGYDQGRPGGNPAVDCLICHAASGTYTKEKNVWGAATATTDLVAAAQGVGTPTRSNCLACHASAGGGNNVKKGDMSNLLASTTADHDVHMGTDGGDMTCQDCHTTNNHKIPGASVHMAGSDEEGVVTCTRCHSLTGEHTNDLIASEHINVACQTCHIPQFSRGQYTKMSWDWSTAGAMTKDGGAPTLANCNPSDPTKTYIVTDPVTGVQTYFCAKGSFTWGADVTPTYAWWNGASNRYNVGDAITSDPVVLTSPDGALGDGKIYPFKVMEGTQGADTGNNIMAIPHIQPGAGYWAHYNWNTAFTDGAATAGIPYSGTYDWQDTEMYLLVTHEVAPAANALACEDCHDDAGEIVMDYAALGYSAAEIATLEVIWDPDNLLFDANDPGSTSDVPALPAIGFAVVGGSLLVIALRRLKSNK